MTKLAIWVLRIARPNSRSVTTTTYMSNDGRFFDRSCPIVAHVSRPLRPYDARACCAEDASRTWLSLQVTSPRSSRDTGYRPPALPDRDFCAWLFLASPSGLSEDDRSQDPCRLLAGQVPCKRRSRHPQRGKPAGARMADVRHMGVRNKGCVVASLHSWRAVRWRVSISLARLSGRQEGGCAKRGA
jgi:hypothetical protein